MSRMVRFSDSDPPTYITRVIRPVEESTPRVRVSTGAANITNHPDASRAIVVQCLSRTEPRCHCPTKRLIDDRRYRKYPWIESDQQSSVPHQIQS